MMVIVSIRSEKYLEKDKNCFSAILVTLITLFIALMQGSEQESILQC